LVPLGGRPLLEWVWRRARESKRLREVLVATDDERIRDHCRAIGAPVVMTDARHATGTDRIAEVAQDLADDVIVNIQGDEPLIDPRAIDAAVEALVQDPSNRMATVAHPASPECLHDPNRVKVTIDRRGFALYFSRACIPHAPIPHTPISHTPTAGEPTAHWLHVGLYAYRRELLLQYGDLPRGAAEEAEALEQLRALENGIPIRVAVVEDWGGMSVDVPEDVARVEARLAQEERTRSGRR
jgi:3-deoxy-manno-octulosonate cytidylyltransferase (CMP-KDO synthetase)